LSFYVPALEDLEVIQRGCLADLERETGVEPATLSLGS
jgi:hypothetical protein